MATDKTEPFREIVDALVAAWMKDCLEPVCALSDELRLRATLTRVFSATAATPEEREVMIARLREAV